MLRLATVGLCLLLSFVCLNLRATEKSLQGLLEQVHQRYAKLDEGELADYIPALAEADANDFGLVIATADGDVFAVGDADRSFAIMSAAKPFSLARLMAASGGDFVRERIGVEPTGLPFNALSNIENPPASPLNPLVNAGAIATVSHLPGENASQRWQGLLDFYSALAGEPLSVMQPVYRSVSNSNFRNRAVANLLMQNGLLGADPDSSLDIYNKQSCVGVTARQLAMMGATLANAGVQPASGERLLAEDEVSQLLAVMLVAGFYDESGTWAYTTGIPAKSGVGGGIVAVVPGRMAIAAYSPPLSPAGNSVRGMRAIADIGEALGLNIFSSATDSAE